MLLLFLDPEDAVDGDISSLFSLSGSEFDPRTILVAPYAVGSLAEDIPGTSVEELVGTIARSSGTGAEDRSGTFSGGSTGRVS